jgi:hypothetical protein
MPAGTPPGMVGPIGQWAGEPRPPVPTDVPQRGTMQHRDPTITRETQHTIGRPPVSKSTRTPRRPAAGAVIAIGVVGAALPILWILLDGLSGPTRSASGVISALLGLPLGGLGLHGLASGAPRAADAPAREAWLRPPVAYLTVGLILFVAAGLAAS